MERDKKDDTHELGTMWGDDCMNFDLVLKNLGTDKMKLKEFVGDCIFRVWLENNDITFTICM